MDVIFVLNETVFEWDDQKAVRNLRDHKFEFEEAAQTFFDPFAHFGDASPPHEKRDYVIGYTFKRDLLYTVYVERGLNVRIISAREATPKERRIYEQGE